jgi:pimeloyl-ACP methyl ester carboxylesterase
VPFDGDDYGQDWLMTEVNIDWPIDRQRFHVFSYTATPVVAFPLPANRWRVFLPQVPNRAGERQPPDMQEIERLIAQRGPAAMKLTNPTLLQAFRCYRRSTRIMRHGRLLVAGDAAHIHSPAGGQGMNTGLHDACNLGWKLAGVAQRQASPELLNTYQDERLPIAAGVLEFTHTLVRLFTISSPRKRWLRDRVLPIAMSVPAAERNYTRSLSQVSHSYRGGPLAPSSSRPKRGSIAAGDRLPSVFGLERDGKPLSTLDLLGSTAHTLLVFSGQRADQEAAAAAIAHLAPFNGTVRIVSVDQRPGTHKPHSVTDPQLRAHRRYGALRGQLFLVRPDGYLACRAPLNRPDIPERYLDRLTSQLARTQSTTKSSSSRANGGRVASLAVEGTELFYEERGSGPTILLIHCTGGNGDVWAPVLGGLAGGHRVIVYDRRGHSRSAQPPVKDLDVHVRDAAALVRALDAAPATAVGWSWGGLIALGLAIQAPELVSGLVLEEPPLHAKKHPAWDQIRAIGSAQLLRMAGRQRQGARVFLRWAFSYRTGGTAFDRLPDDLQKAMLANARAVMWELDAGTGEELTAERIAAIKCPVTCLVGDLTPKPILNATDRLLDMLPQASRTTIEGAAHAIHFDRPAEFVQAVQHAAA